MGGKQKRCYRCSSAQHIAAQCDRSVYCKKCGKVAHKQSACVQEIKFPVEIWQKIVCFAMDAADTNTILQLRLVSTQLFSVCECLHLRQLRMTVFMRSQSHWVSRLPDFDTFVLDEVMHIGGPRFVSELGRQVLICNVSRQVAQRKSLVPRQIVFTTEYKVQTASQNRFTRLAEEREAYNNLCTTEKLRLSAKGRAITAVHRRCPDSRRVLPQFRH